jgi:hypothetical protein
MTPYELTILLNVHVGMPISVSQDTVLFVETMRSFMDEGWVVSAPGLAYTATPKLRAFIEFILNLPAPRQAWLMPELRALKEAA